MEISIFKSLKFSALICFCSNISVMGLMPACDISDLIVRPVTKEALTIWALLDLAEHEHIIDQKLFYDELCQATLKLCKEVQLLKDSGYDLADCQMASFGKLFDFLHKRFKALPEMAAIAAEDQQYINAIDVILQYADYFLKNNLRVDADGETTHARF